MNIRHSSIVIAIACAVAFTPSAAALTRIKVSAEPQQRVTGFGAAAMWHLMAPMADANIINYLYGDNSPVGLNIMRMEIGPQLSAPDGAYNSWDKYVGVVKAAKARGAIVFATPWSPPGEYKTNGSASGGEPDVRGKLRDDCADKFFPWLNTFLMYMSRNGAPVDIVSLQNEPDWWVSYSGCLYSPEEMHDLVAAHADALKKDLFHVRLMGSESLNHNPDYARALLGDPATAQYIDIIGGHIYGNRPLYNMKQTANIAAAHGKETWMTEHYVEGGDGTWTDDLRFAQEVNETMLAGGNAYVSWYMIGPGAFCGDGRDLDQYPDNQWGAPYLPRCMAMAHFSKHVTGATRLATTPEIPADGADFEYSAYRKGDYIYVVIINLAATRATAKLELPAAAKAGSCIQSTEGNLYASSELNIAEPQSSFNIIVPAKSITTYIYNVAEGEADDVVPAKALKLPASGNPLCPFMYTADPTAVEYEGRLYVYATNDTEEFIAQGRQGGNTYGAIRTIAVMSSDDLVNWTFHGLIPAADICGSWCANSWAPSVVSRVEDDGLTHFYMYISNNGSGIGVLTATSPVGPWTAPRTTPLIDRSTPGVGSCAAPMDPGVVIDDDGTGWIAFGGGDSSTGSEVFAGNARIARLKPSLTEIDGEAVAIQAPYHFEANELNYMDGKWVYTYCSRWGNRDEWSSVGSTVKAPSLCSMDYMVSTDPLNAASWKYVGEYFANPGTFGYPYYNNHTHLHSYLDRYYLLYHTNWLESVSGYGTGGFRCVAISNANVRQRAAFISPVTADDDGVAARRRLDPYAGQQAETMSTCGGLDYDNFVNATNQALRLSHRELVIANIPEGAWTMVRNADFGDAGASAFVARLKGRGQLQVRLDDVSSAPVATVDFSSAGWEEVSVDLDASACSGVHDVYFLFTQTRIAQFDRWHFTSLADGITETADEKLQIANGRMADGRSYDLSGRLISADSHRRGIRIVNGRKVVSSKK